MEDGSYATGLLALYFYTLGTEYLVITGLNEDLVFSMSASTALPNIQG